MGPDGTRSEEVNVWGGVSILPCDNPLHFSGLFCLLESPTWVGPHPFLSQGLLRWFSLLSSEILFLLSLPVLHDTMSWAGILGHLCLCLEAPSVFFLEASWVSTDKM